LLLALPLNHSLCSLYPCAFWKLCPNFSSCGFSGTQVLISPPVVSQGPKSSFITPEKRAKLRSNPVKVRFAEEVEVNSHSQVRQTLTTPYCHCMARYKPSMKLLCHICPGFMYDLVYTVTSRAPDGHQIKCIYKALRTSADISKCCTETQPNTPNSKQCRCRSTVAWKNSLERPRKAKT
jgi:hypothetical protein